MLPILYFFLKAIFVELKGIREQKKLKGKEENREHQEHIESNLTLNVPVVILYLLPD
jgi:hypothetical protein